MGAEVRYGDLLERVTSGVILQQVNAQGVMGSGIAKAIRKRWPNVWDDYRHIVKANPTEEESGSLMGTIIWSEVGESLYVASIVGQQFFSTQDSSEDARFTSYDALDVALTEVGNVVRRLLPNTIVHYPLLGSDRGRGHWPIVKSILTHRLAGLEQRLWLLPGAVEPT